MASHTYAEIASSFELWQEYVDTAGTTSREEFDAMSTADRIAAQIEAFGPELPHAPTVDEVLARCELRGWLGEEQLVGWDDDGGEIMVPVRKLQAALEAAYDPTMPNWPAMVEIDDA